MWRALVVWAAVLGWTIAAVIAAEAGPGPEFKLGFKAMAERIPEVVGQPIEDEQHGPSGDALQRTTTGLMVWRKADNWTAFTNGSRTWVDGPFGVMERGNDHRFPWEAPPLLSPIPGPPLAPAAPPALPTVAATATSTSAPARRYSPEVKAMDPESAGPGFSVAGWMRQIDEEWERVWGWKPGKPTTIYLYLDGYRLAEGLATVSGEPLTAADKRFIAQSVHALATEDKQTGGWAVLVNMGHDYGQAYWEPDTRQVLIHEYAHVMQFDVAGHTGPVWFLEGIAQLCAFTTVPQALKDSNRLATTARLSCLDQLPSLRTLNDTWGSLFGDDPQLAYGMAYFAVKRLSERVGGMPLLRVLQRTAGGEPFEESLQKVTGYTLDSLDREYRRTPCTAYR